MSVCRLVDSLSNVRDLLDVKPAPPGHCISLWNCEKYLEYSSWIRLLYKYSVRTAGPLPFSLNYEIQRLHLERSMVAERPLAL